MTILWPCPVPIDACLRAVRRVRPPAQRCPTCRTELALQGGYRRRLRHDATTGSLWVWRAYCRACDRSHALLPDFVVAHHLDTSDTIYAAVEHNQAQGVTSSTRRGWQARYRRNTNTLTSACASATARLGGDPHDWRVGQLVVALWVAARRHSYLIPMPWRILNIISGRTWIRERVNSSWGIAGRYPVPP